VTGPSGPQHHWYDDEAGPVVRLYALTGGRARPSSEVFDVVTMVTVEPGALDDTALGPEQAAVLTMCRGGPQSVAELAAGCDLPLGVTRVLLSDLLEVGHIRVRQPLPPSGIFGQPILQEVLDGLRAL
jgi:hypothetical protein